MSQTNWLGVTLGNRYLIQEPLGKGGMSAVFKGTDPNLRRTVAIKIIHPHLASDPQFVRRFEEEAAAVARLRHPHIIQVFDFNHSDDVYYMILEYIEGQTLDSYQAHFKQVGQRLGRNQILFIMERLCQAVGYAHNQGMVHRDLKPSNVMIRPDGEPVLMDFGIAKMIEAEQYTITGALIGTVAYMAPEQIKGENPDHRVDIYALGVMLFELATGRRPFEGINATATILMHLTDPVPDIVPLVAAENPAEWAELNEIIQTAMHKNPDGRYKTAEQMRAAIQTLQGYTTSLNPAELWGNQQDTLITPPSEKTVPGQMAYTLQNSYNQPTELIPPPPPPSPPTDLALNKRITLLTGLVIVTLVGMALLLGGVYLALTNPDPAATNATTEAELLLTLDRDQDGLTNSREVELGTDPDVADTDGDGLTDEYEVSIPCLNPLAADTDGDGATDNADANPCVADNSTLRVEITAIHLISTTTPPAGDMYGQATPEATLTSDEPQIYWLYEIDFTTTGYTPTAGDRHVHLFFNTVTQENAGKGGEGPWSIYAGESPFQDPNNTPASRPEGATALCALVANADHTVIRNTGNCLELPAGP